MRTHDQIVSKLLRRPGVKKEVERIEREESEPIDQLLRAQHESGLTGTVEGIKKQLGLK